ncbi:hypothetical protein IV203_005119 [Nitzschia inconspicua]|uniref:Uncharacterized protein n=1 Tax=Nitzschia inconspicua TaxID=303405 RepID=A0A9K3KMC0_9STRA|nr:hypothetical protein IV203_005119 [Nitzschia inconspicua]
MRRSQQDDSRDGSDNKPGDTTSAHPVMFSPVVGTASRTTYSVASDDDDDENDRFHSSANHRRRHYPLHPTVTPRSHAAAYNVDDLLGLDDNSLDDEFRTPLLFHDDNDDNESRNGRRRRPPPPPPLNGLNYLNVITYGLNVFVSYGIGYAGLFGILPTRWDISKQFETLVTPAEWAYYLWVPILIFECIFAVCQLLPKFRQRPIIQEGTGLFFFYICIIQTAWTLFFAFRLFVLAFVAVVAALLCLASLLASQQLMRGNGGSSRKSNLLEYWLFRFPFYIHAGWLIMCSVVQWSILFRYYTSNVGVQLAADIVALGVMLPPSTFFLTGQPSGPDFVIPLVIVWSYISIGLELRHPNDDLKELYGHDAIVAVRDATYFMAGIVVLMLIPRVFIWLVQEFCTITVIELMAEDEDEGEGYFGVGATTPADLTGTPSLTTRANGHDNIHHDTPNTSSRRVSFSQRLEVEDDEEGQNLPPPPIPPPDEQ